VFENLTAFAAIGSVSAEMAAERRILVAQASESIFLVDAHTKQILETNTAFENLGFHPKKL